MTTPGFSAEASLTPMDCSGAGYSRKAGQTAARRSASNSVVPAQLGEGFDCLLSCIEEYVACERFARSSSDLCFCRNYYRSCNGSCTGRRTPHEFCDI